jgi:hypothetical protein
MKPLRDVDPVTRRARLLAARLIPVGGINRKAILGGYWDGGSVVGQFRSGYKPSRTPRRAIPDRDSMIETALRDLRDEVITALEQNPRIKAASRIQLEKRLEEATDAINLPERRS